MQSNAAVAMNVTPVLPSSPVRIPPERNRKVRKRSEADSDPRPSVKTEVGHSQFYTKVPLTVLNTDLNCDDYASNIKRQATIRVKKMSSMTESTSRFPKLNDCAHFHYDHVELGDIQLCMYNDQEDEFTSSTNSSTSSHSANGVVIIQTHSIPEFLEANFTVRVSSNGKIWLIKRSYEDFRVLDKQLHSCIYDRRFSQLVELPKGIQLSTSREDVRALLSHYVSRFSQIAGDMINCGPVLNWMEADNHGNHVIASEESAINIPAVAAAHVVKRYIAQAVDEISLEVGDMISVIDMPPPEETAWWRGKNGFDVGFFPSQCVEIIGERLPPSVAQRVPKLPKPVLRKHGKLITFLRSFMLARPTKRGLLQRGILRERVFGCDLGEHLLNSGNEVPMVIKVCTEFIEKHGVVDGIYRLSGVASNIQRLRDEFDSETLPDLSEYEKDIHCVSSVCKLYFRELPNPLLTYQLYKHFEEAAMIDAEDQLIKMHDTVQQLPPPHYRTLEFLIQHLVKISANSSKTGMNVKNLAIVWAPNLLRAKDIETGSCAAFFEIKVQATVVEYLVRYADLIFNNKLLPDGASLDISQEMNRPKSLVLSAPTKLITLEEAQARSSAISLDQEEKPKYIEVGGGPAALPKQYHTVIDLPYDRKRLSSKAKKSISWKLFFSRSSNKEAKRKIGAPTSPQVIVKFSTRNRGVRSSLRSVRSEESLSSSEALNHKIESDGEAEVVKIKLRSRSSSVACVEAFRRSSSHSSFFEVDPEVIAAASRDMLDATITESHDSHYKSEGRGSPMWIDQSISSSESEVLLPLSGKTRKNYLRKEEGIKERLSGQESISKDCKSSTQREIIEEGNSKAVVKNSGKSLSGEKDMRNSSGTKDDKVNRVSSVGEEENGKGRNNYVPTKVPKSESFKGKRGTGRPDSGSALEKELTAGEIYNLTLSSTDDHTKQTRNTNSNSSPTKSKSSSDGSSSGVRLRMDSDSPSSSPVKRRSGSSKGSRRKKQDVQAQTPTESEFPKDENMFSLGDIEGAILGTASPRKMAFARTSYEDPFDPDTKDQERRLVSPNGYSLENVLSEYDYMMEKYTTHATTPDFFTSSDSLAVTNWKEMNPEQKNSMQRSASGPHIRRVSSENHEDPILEEKVGGLVEMKSEAPLASSDNSINDSGQSFPIPPPRRRRSPGSRSPPSPVSPVRNITPPSSPGPTTEDTLTPPSCNSPGSGSVSRTFVLSGLPSPITKVAPSQFFLQSPPKSPQKSENRLSNGSFENEDNIAPTEEFSSPELSPLRIDLHDFSKELERVEQMLAANTLPSICRVLEEQPPVPSICGVLEEQPPVPSICRVLEEQSPVPSICGVLEEQSPVPSICGVLKEQPPVSSICRVLEEQPPEDRDDNKQDTERFEEDEVFVKDSLPPKEISNEGASEMERESVSHDLEEHLYEGENVYEVENVYIEAEKNSAGDNDVKSDNSLDFIPDQLESLHLDSEEGEDRKEQTDQLVSNFPVRESDFIEDSEVNSFRRDIVSHYDNLDEHFISNVGEVEGYHERCEGNLVEEEDRFIISKMEEFDDGGDIDCAMHALPGETLIISDVIEL